MFKWKLTIKVLLEEATEELSDAQFFDYLSRVCNNEDVDNIKIRDNRIDILFRKADRIYVEIIAERQKVVEPAS